MKIGYARTSTLDQVAGFDAQVEKLSELGCEKVFKEQVSSVARRDELQAALDFIREGDTLTVCKLDRLARSTHHLLEIINLIEEKNASLEIVDMGIDSSSATGRLMVTVIAAIAQFEREMMLERQREGIAKAKAEGKYKGRKATAMQKRDEIFQLKKEGVGASAIARKLNISRASVYRVLKAQI